MKRTLAGMAGGIALAWAGAVACSATGLPSAPDAVADAGLAPSDARDEQAAASTCGDPPFVDLETAFVLNDVWAERVLATDLKVTSSLCPSAAFEVPRGELALRVTSERPFVLRVDAPNAVPQMLPELSFASHAKIDVRIDPGAFRFMLPKVRAEGYAIVPYVYPSYGGCGGEGTIISVPEAPHAKIEYASRYGSVFPDATSMLEDGLVLIHGLPDDMPFTVRARDADQPDCALGLASGRGETGRFTVQRGAVTVIRVTQLGGG